MNQDAVMVPVAESTKAGARRLSMKGRQESESKTGSGFRRNPSNWIGREVVYPSNVLHLATECGNKGHSAVFPEALPAFFIKLFTKPGDVVVDPFVGSGTTVVAAKRLGRQFVGIDIVPEYIRVATRRLWRTPWG